MGLEMGKKFTGKHGQKRQWHHVKSLFRVFWSEGGAHWQAYGRLSLARVMFVALLSMIQHAVSLTGVDKLYHTEHFQCKFMLIQLLLCLCWLIPPYFCDALHNQGEYSQKCSVPLVPSLCWVQRKWLKSISSQQDQVAGYSCACDPGWTGTYCSVNINCLSSPCQNGATCIVSTH